METHDVCTQGARCNRISCDTSERRFAVLVFPVSLLLSSFFFFSPLSYPSAATTTTQPGWKPMARITNSFVDRYGRNVDRRKDAKIYRDVDRTGIGVMYEAGREIVAAFFGSLIGAGLPRSLHSLGRRFIPSFERSIAAGKR